MRNLLAFLFLTAIAAGASAQKAPDGFVLVEGGTFKNTKTSYYGKNITLRSFYIGKCEVTQKEWTDVTGRNPSQFKGDNLPVETVSWYDCIEYCNQRSLKEGLKPYYNVDKTKKDPNNLTGVDDLKWIVTVNAGANGYRLPTEAEWEYAASGGQQSKNFTYCGSDDVAAAGWYWINSGDKTLFGAYWSWPLIQGNHNKTHPVGGKEANELGLSDMSGNVREWCWDWFGELTSDGSTPKGSSAETGRVWKGGGWMGGDFCCAPSFRASFEASGKGPDQGLRLCRNQ